MVALRRGLEAMHNAVSGLAAALGIRRDVFRVLPRNGIGAEIGVWEGDFSARALEVARPEKLHLIDPWRFMASEPYSKSRYGGKFARSQADMDALYEKVQRRFAHELDAGFVKIHRSESAAAAAQFPDHYFDWVYIDGNHLYEFVKLDLELYGPKVKHGGLIAGDDYLEEGWWKGGVRKAVDEYLASDGCEVVWLGAQFVLRRL